MNERTTSLHGTGTNQPTLTRVVLPVDHSEESLRARCLAERLSSSLAVPLVVVSVVNNVRTDALERIAWLEPLLGKPPDNTERRIVQSSTPAKAIAEESAGGLVCMATSATIFDTDGLRGSTAEFVVAASRSPVVLVGPLCDATSEFERIVVGIDPAHPQSSLLHWAVRLGYQLRVPLDFVHVGSDPTVALPPAVRRVEPGPGQSVAHCLDEQAEGAIVAIGCRGRVGLARLTEGSVGAALLARSERPVLILGQQVPQN
jgi:nucleotide-binding universal stress UspA family protein